MGWTAARTWFPDYLAAVTLEDGAAHVATHPQDALALVVTPRSVRRYGARGDGSFACTAAFAAALHEPEREGYVALSTAHRLYRQLQRGSLRKNGGA